MNLEDAVLQFVTSNQAIETLKWEIRSLNRTLRIAKQKNYEALRAMENIVELPKQFVTLDEVRELYIPSYDSDGLPY